MRKIQFTVQWLRSFDSRSIRGFVKIILVFFLIEFVGSMLMHFLGKGISKSISSFLGIADINHRPVSSRILLHNGFLEAAFWMILWAPVIEEVIFRLWIKYSRQKIIISLTGIAVFTFVQFLNYEKIQIHNVGSFKIFLVFIITYIFLYSFKEIFPLSVNINAKWGILTSGVVFGLVHLTNYNFSIDPWYLCLPMVLPQIFSGILLGTVRCFYGFSFGVIIHMLLNSLSLFAALV